MFSEGRRNWIKRGTLALGAMALTPYDTWAVRVEKAQQAGATFLYDENQRFNEFTPPLLVNTNSVQARLAWNENPYGSSVKASEAFIEAVKNANHYNWVEMGQLIKKIAEKEGVKPTQIMMGPGSTDLLERTSMYYFKNKGNIVSADPAYMSLVEVAVASGGTWKPIKLAKDYSHDLDAMEKAIDADTKIVYITNPNNPTATTTNSKKLRAFCERVSKKVPVFVDEAYLELSDGGLHNSMATLVAEGKNVIVARTFSKIHGMAGMRVGYIVANEAIIDALSKFTIPGFGLTGPSIAAANASLDDAENIKACKDKLVATRNKTMDFFKQKEINYMPSQANFILFEINMDGKLFLEKIAEKGVLLRSFKFWDKNWCRVSMGTPTEMEIFYKAIEELM